MDKTILAFIEKLETFKTKIKALHWDSDNLSQHKLCDEIAESIAEFQDQVSEVEQSISGKLPKNMFRPDNQNYGEVGTLKEFVKNVIDTTNEFYKKLQDKGDEYIGMRSDCESFLSDMQRKLYLVNFTMKEDMKRRITKMVNESRPKNLANIPDDSKIQKLKGRRPTTYEGRKNQINKITGMFGVGKKVYTDESWEAIDEYSRAISLLEIVDDVAIFPCANLNKPDWDIQSDGGYCDYDETDHMPRSKQYKIIITYFDGMKIEGYIKCMAAGTIEKPFSRYDTCMVLWPKNNRKLGENKEMDGQRRLSEGAFMNDWFKRKEEEHLEKSRRGLRKKQMEDFYQSHPDFRPGNGRVEENINRRVALTEADIRRIITEVIDELKVIKSTHGHRKNDVEKVSPEERKKARIRLGIEPGYNRKGERINKESVLSRIVMETMQKYIKKNDQD
jgi:hypothetical protein